VEAIGRRTDGRRHGSVVAGGAGHVEAWNVNPELYERRLRNFLGSLGLGENRG
jgi:hypothetical protein